MQAAFFRQHGGPEVTETSALPDPSPHERLERGAVLGKLVLVI